MRDEMDSQRPKFTRYRNRLVWLWTTVIFTFSSHLLAARAVDVRVESWRETLAGVNFVRLVIDQLPPQGLASIQVGRSGGTGGALLFDPTKLRVVEVSVPAGTFDLLSANCGADLQDPLRYQCPAGAGINDPADPAGGRLKVAATRFGPQGFSGGAFLVLGMECLEQGSHPLVVTQLDVFADPADQPIPLQLGACRTFGVSPLFSTTVIF